MLSLRPESVLGRRKATLCCKILTPPGTTQCGSPTLSWLTTWLSREHVERMELVLNSRQTFSGRRRNHRGLPLMTQERKPSYLRGRCNCPRRRKSVTAKLQPKSSPRTLPSIVLGDEQVRRNYRSVSWFGSPRHTAIRARQ